MLVPFVIGVVLIIDVLFVLITGKPKILNTLKERKVIDKMKFKLAYSMSSILLIMVAFSIPAFIEIIGIFYAYMILFFTIIAYTVIQTYIIERFTKEK